MNAGVAFIAKKMKAAMKQHGASGFLGLQRKFRIMDGKRFILHAHFYRPQNNQYATL